MKEKDTVKKLVGRVEKESELLEIADYIKIQYVDVSNVRYT